jgi:AraC-like DNA-binding protein
VCLARRPRRRRDLGALREFCLVSVLRNAHGLACWLVDSRIPLIAAEFAFDAPPHADAYAVLFRGPVTFHAPRTAMHFDARYLHLPLRRDEQALRQMLQHALPLTVLHYRRDRLLVQRVRQLLAAPLPGQPAHALPQHSAESLAALLHVSPRTLHRQLKEEGATLQGLKDEVRRTRAVELLHRTSAPSSRWPRRRGLRTRRVLSGRFRGWTGQSPAELIPGCLPARAGGPAPGRAGARRGADDAGARRAAARLSPLLNP